MDNFAKYDPERASKATAAIPMKRGGQPKELADAVLFLVSDESRYVTGLEFKVDAGVTLR